MSLARILVIDDEPYVRELLNEFLTGLGYNVATAATGNEALDAVPTFQPDVIVVDRLMPGLSGEEVLDALRRTARTVPVILVSGNTASAGDGFFAILEKPFKLQRMAEVLAEAVNRGRIGRAGMGPPD